MSARAPERQGWRRERTRSGRRARKRMTMTPSAFAKGPSQSLGRREAGASQTTVRLPFRLPSPLPQGTEWRTARMYVNEFRPAKDPNRETGTDSIRVQVNRSPRTCRSAVQQNRERRSTLRLRVRPRRRRVDATNSRGGALYMVVSRSRGARAVGPQLRQVVADRAEAAASGPPGRSPAARGSPDD